MLCSCEDCHQFALSKSVKQEHTRALETFMASTVSWTVFLLDSIERTLKVRTWPTVKGLSLFLMRWYIFASEFLRNPCKPLIPRLTM